MASKNDKKIIIIFSLISNFVIFLNTNIPKTGRNTTATWGLINSREANAKIIAINLLFILIKPHIKRQIPKKVMESFPIPELQKLIEGNNIDTKIIHLNFLLKLDISLKPEYKKTNPKHENKLNINEAEI